MAKKAAHATPNLLLRRARLERGWTQKMVAEHIGAPNDVIVTRWERGTAFPSPHYVQQLCQLFEQQASDLGLLKESHVVAASHRHTPRQPPPAARGDPVIAPAQHNSPLLSSLPVIGRDVDLRTLQTCYENVQHGQLQVVLLQGEAGIGKTRLASSFLTWAAAQGATLLTGRAFEMGGRVPYQPLVHALSRRLEEEPAPEALLSATWLSELARILPELRERYPTLPEVAGDDMTARIRLFEAVTRLGQALCERAPVVLAIDDIHWADAASRDVLHYTAHRWMERGMPLLLLLALRSEALTTTGSLSTWITGLYHALPVTDLTLGPLTLDQTRQLLDAIVGRPPLKADQPDRVAKLGQWLFRETGGHPFYLVETVKDLVERHVLTLDHTAHGEALRLDTGALSAVQHQRVLPPGVRRLILSNLERLTTAGHALVTASAILGQAASFDVLCRVAEVDDRAAPAALDEVLRYGLLREVRDATSRGVHYVPGHDKIREVVATEMGEAQRQLLHRRALTALEAEARSAAELAYHALAGGLAEQAIGFSLTAGDEAVRLFANTEAQLHYTQALDGLAQLPATGATQRARVETILKLAQISWMVEDVEHTLERLAEAAELAQALHDHRQRAAVHYWIGVVYGTRYATRQARAHAERGLVEAQALGDDELVALASLQLSRVLSVQGQFNLVDALLTPIIPVFERTANWPAWTDALGCVGVARTAQGQCAEGEALGRRALERACRPGDWQEYNEVKARHFLSIMYLYSGELVRMLEENDWVLKEAQRIGDKLLAYRAFGFRSWAQARMGQHEAAMQSMARAQAAGSRIGGHILGQDLLGAVTAELLLAAGRVDEALARAEATVALAREEVGGILSEGLAERVWGEALARLARWAEAETHLAASLQTLLSGEARLEAARAHVVWGLLCRDHGDTQSARAHLEQAGIQFETSGLTGELVMVQQVLARLDAELT